MRQSIFLTFFIVLISNMCPGQSMWDTKNQLSTGSPVPIRHRTPIWLTPVGRTTEINGVAAGLISMPVGKAKSLKINGVSIEANPVIPYAAIVISMGCLIGVITACLTKKDPPGSELYRFRIHRKKPPKDTTIAKIDTVFRTTINGLSISTGVLSDETKINGAAMNVLFGFENELNGIEVSSLLNKHFRFRGVIIAGVNSTKTGKGVQIGLYNKCDNGKLLQIGLLNKIGKRTTPFVNFRFRRAKQV